MPVVTTRCCGAAQARSPPIELHGLSARQAPARVADPAHPSMISDVRPSGSSAVAAERDLRRLDRVGERASVQGPAVRCFHKETCMGVFPGGFSPFEGRCRLLHGLAVVGPSVATDRGGSRRTAPPGKNRPMGAWPATTSGTCTFNSTTSSMTPGSRPASSPKACALSGPGRTAAPTRWRPAPHSLASRMKS